MCVAYTALSCSRQQVAGIVVFSILHYPRALGKGLDEARVWQLKSNACRQAHHARRSIDAVKVVWLLSQLRCKGPLVLGTMDEPRCCAAPEPLRF